jgi:hypothetical protein
MSLCAHHFVTLSFKTAQKASPQSFACVCVCLCPHIYTYMYVWMYVCCVEWNESMLLLQIFDWREFSFINV